MAPSKNLGHGLLAVVHPQEGFGKAMEPPHVHIYDAEGEVKIALDTLVELSNHGMKRSRIRMAIALVKLKRKDLLEMWDASRPTG